MEMNEEMENMQEVEGLDDIEMDNTPVDDLDTENVSLIFTAFDGSGSMYPHISDMKQCLKKFRQALQDSKQADEILLARADFASDINVGGYKPVDQLDTNFNAGGCTVLYDVIVEGVEKLLKYRQFLKDQSMRVKAVFAVFSDGEENGSCHDLGEAKDAIAKLNKEEITTAFISFGSGAQAEAKKLGFRNLLTVNSSASDLRKAFDRLSKSVIESSKTAIPDGEDFFKV